MLPDPYPSLPTPKEDLSAESHHQVKPFFEDWLLLTAPQGVPALILSDFYTPF